MKCTDWFIDADTHITEPGDVWTSRLPRKFQNAAPRMIRSDDGVDFWRFGRAERKIPVGATALAGWPERMADHRESEDFTFVIVRDQWRPWLFAHGLVGPSWARTPAPADAVFDPSLLDDLLADREFYNMVTAYDSDCGFVLNDS